MVSQVLIKFRSNLLDLLRHVSKVSTHPRTEDIEKPSLAMPMKNNGSINETPQ